MTFLSDEELAYGVQRGNGEYLALLVERHHSPLIGYLYRMTYGDRTLAEDLAQEVFLRLMRSIGQYQYPRRFKPWLYQIATNLTRDHYKRAETRSTIAMSEEVGQVSDPLAQPEETLLFQLEAEQVAGALACLPTHQREAVILRYYQELSLAEIADVLDIPVGTVKSRLSLGLGRLRDVLLEREL